MESTQPILRCRYSYDPLDCLISQLQPDASAHQRFYCKNRLATEIRGAIGYSIVQHDNLLLAQHRRQSNVLDTTLLASDQKRSVLNLLKTDNQRQTIAYTPYGHRRAESGLISLLGFNGERSDPVTGHYLLGNGYRAYNPVLMRFNSPDSYSPFGEGGFNAYAYCGGDPITRADKTGHSWYKQFIERTKKSLPSPFNREFTEALGRTKLRLGGSAAIAEMSETIGQTPAQMLYTSTLASQSKKITSKLEALKALNGAEDSLEKTNVILKAKEKIGRAVRISRELERKLPPALQGEFEMDTVRQGEKALDLPPSYSDLVRNRNSRA